MEIANLLQLLHKDAIKELAAEFGIPFGPKEDMILRQKLLEAYTPDNISKKTGELTEQQLTSLEMIAGIFLNYNDGLYVVDAAARINLMIGLKGQGEKMIQSLEKKGLLFRVQHYWKEMLILPDEIWPIIHLNIATRMMNNVTAGSRPAGKVRVLENRGLSLHHDLITLLSSFIHEPVEVTQKRQIYKRTMNKILEKFRSSPARFPQRIGEEAPENFLFLQSFLSRTTLVRFDQIMVVDSRELENFLSAHYVDWSIILYDAFLNQQPFGQDPFPFLILLSMIYRLGKEDWVDAQATFRCFEEELAKWKIPCNSLKFEKLCFNPFLVLGLMQWGQDERGREVWRWTEWGAEFILRRLRGNHLDESRLAERLTEDIFVQPNLEILVPENVLATIRWKVESLAELKQADSVNIYAITKKKILQALESGWNMESIAGFLNRFSKIPVSANVLKTIKDWIGNFGKAVLWDVMVLQVLDQSAADWIHKDKKLGKFIIGSFSDNAFIIRRSDEKQVRNLFMEMGFGIPTRSNNPDRNEQLSSRQDRNGSRMRMINNIDKQSHIEIKKQYNLSCFAPEMCSEFLTIEEVVSFIFDEDDWPNKTLADSIGEEEDYYDY